MVTKEYTITTERLQELKSKYNLTGKNSHIGKFAVEIAKDYFKSLDNNVQFSSNDGVDLQVTNKGVTTDYEIKGTEDANLAWNKIKISSQKCYDRLVQGMVLIRITNIGNKDVKLHFMLYRDDFEIDAEPRWSVKKKKVNPTMA